ncbi:MAG: fluoride efflux transporter CrcB [Phycisphaerae bacterium]|nr:fluoride efflux transporter CrcB [Phycisphaerae bacterium]
MIKYVLLFVGSGLGGVLRFWLGGAAQAWWGRSFPVGTLAVNLSGCLAIGALSAVLSRPGPFRDEYRIFLLAGVLGGYTTFSAFGRETLALVQSGHWGRAGLYIVLSNAGALGAAWLGSLAAGRATPAP